MDIPQGLAILDLQKMSEDLDLCVYSFCISANTQIMISHVADRKSVV